MKGERVGSGSRKVCPVLLPPPPLLPQSRALAPPPLQLTLSFPLSSLSHLCERTGPAARRGGGARRAVTPRCEGVRARIELLVVGAGGTPRCDRGNTRRSGGEKGGGARDWERPTPRKIGSLFLGSPPLPVPPFPRSLSSTGTETLTHGVRHARHPVPGPAPRDGRAPRSGGTSADAVSKAEREGRAFVWTGVAPPAGMLVECAAVQMGERWEGGRRGQAGGHPPPTKGRRRQRAARVCGPPCPACPSQLLACDARARGKGGRRGASLRRRLATGGGQKKVACPSADAPPSQPPLFPPPQPAARPPHRRRTPGRRPAPPAHHVAGVDRCGCELERERERGEQEQEQ